MSRLLVLSHYQIKPLLEAKRAGEANAVTSPDLGISTCQVALDREFITFPSNERVTWAGAERIAQSLNNCFKLVDNSLVKIQVFSEETNRLYSLYPTTRAPTMLVSGIPMHRIKGTDPLADTLAKIKTVSPLAGRVLDTATGLGYTAIAAAETAERVVTIELDKAALEIARQNPWSARLFDNPKINQIVGDTFEEIESFEAASFSRIIHDPPMFNLAGDLYSEEFYRQLYRVISHGGRVFHYIGDLESKSGRNIVRGVVNRLKASGFQRIERKPQAFGVVATKR